MQASIVLVIFYCDRTEDPKQSLDTLTAFPNATSKAQPAEHGPHHQPVGLGALSSQSMLVLMVTSRFYVFSTSHC